MDLAAIDEVVRACTRCDLAQTRTHAVPGEGTASAGIFLVGEAPGRNEDETGRPFCGAAGKNLDLGLAAAAIARESAFVTSIVKCRPPKNRDPTKAEKTACRPHLLAQIEALEPRVLVALGRHGLSGLMPDAPSKFADVRGTFCGEYEGIPIWASLHPAAIIYRQAWKTQYLADWESFGSWLASGAAPEAYERVELA